MWVAYYRREWLTFLRHAIGLTRHVFGLPWPATIYASWFALRGIQLWAPYPDNDPERSRQSMERFYKLVARHQGERFDPARAAELEIEWWRVHREVQYADPPIDPGPIVDALAALYAYAYDVPEAEVRGAAEQRTIAMRYSDQWVSEGCDPSSTLIADERAALVRSYAGLLAAVHRA